MPRSLAIWACDFWLDWTNFTASTLNSLVNVRCSFCMIFSLPVSGSLFQVYLPLFSGSRPPCPKTVRCSLLLFSVKLTWSEKGGLYLTGIRKRVLLVNHGVDWFVFRC